MSDARLLPEPLASARSRSWLFVPGASERFVAKLPVAVPDAVILDLEDGVAHSELPAARLRLERLLSPGGEAWLPPLVAVRSHAARHAGFEADLDCLGPRAHALVLPKVSGPGDVALAAEKLAGLGLEHVVIVATVESAGGLTRLDEVLAHPLVVGVAFGAEDFAADVGLPPATGSWNAGADNVADSLAAAGRASVLDIARSRISIAAAAAGSAWRIDSPTLQLGDEPAVEAAARAARSFGFSGKFAIHPAQVPALHAGFRPSDEEIEWAKSVLVADGAGATSAAGQMVDEAVVRQARAVIALDEE